MISIKNAQFSYGKHLVFKDVSLNVTQGEVLCLMGPNGCGKSTLIECVLGTRQLDEGKIFLHGKELNSYRVPEIAEHIAYIPQYHEQTFDYTVEQVVLMGCSPKGRFSMLSAPRKEDLDIVREALEQVNISHMAYRSYTKLSGGEIRLVLLARALAQKTPILVLDEPTAFLDLYNELLFLETVLNLVKTMKKTLIMATHSPNHGFYYENHGVPTRIVLFGREYTYNAGTPEAVITEQALAKVYGIQSEIVKGVKGNEKELKQVISHSTIPRKENHG